jgi:pimeloyl-ACP methyl ester carboxylesterase
MATQSGVTTPTIVLVHGAWADASGFAAVISALRDRGFHAVGFANPCSDLPTTRRTWPTSCGASVVPSSSSVTPTAAR